MIRQTINIVTRFNAKTGLLAAYSDDLPGLLVVARNIPDLEKSLPEAVRELLEAQGQQVEHVELLPAEGAGRWTPEPKFRAEAELQRAA